MSSRVDIAELIKDNVDIAEAIGRVVALKKSGRTWHGLCPFHSETDGSFHVYDADGTRPGSFICFGCHAKGDVISFYMRYYHLSFIEACEKICAEYGIDWQSDREKNVDKSRDALYEANRLAGSTYYSAIRVEGNAGLEYMLKRGINRAAISKFRIGYADGSGRMLASKLMDDERLTKAAEELGLIRKDGGRYRDLYVNRVMFPIISVRGKVIGFGGRDLTGKSKAKYINSSGSAVFEKGKNLFGLNITGASIRERGFAILVEGYMDLVALYMHGVTNVAAQLGTAFTKEQAKLLGKFTKNIILSLDSDESGLKAALATMDILAAEGHKVRVLVLEGAKDPDEFIGKFGREAFERAVDAAIPMIDFKLARLRLGYDLAVSDGIVDFLKAAAKVIAPLSPIEQDLHIRKLAEQTGISEAAIRLQTGAAESPAPGGTAPRARKPERNEKSTDTEGSENRTTVRRSLLLKNLLAICLRSSEILKRSVEYRHFFAGTEYEDIFTAIMRIYDDTGDLPEKNALSELIDEADLQLLEDILRINIPAVMSEAAGEYMIRFEIEELKERERAIANDEAFSSGDTEAAKEYMTIRERIKQLEDMIRKGEINW